MSSRHHFGLVVLSAAVALLALGLWLHIFGVSGQVFADLFGRLKWWPVPPLLALLCGHVALSSWRWSLIEQGLGGSRPKFEIAFVVGAVALGLGTFLPPPLTNVACRSFSNRFSGTSGLRGALSGGIDQLSDLGVIILLSIPAAVGLIYRNVDLYFAGVGLTIILGLGVLSALSAFVRSGALPFRVPLIDRFAPLADRKLALRLYAISLGRVANLTLMTLLVQAAVGVGDPRAIIVGVPVITLAVSVAMLPGAFGVSEWSFSAVLSDFGASGHEIVLFVLANRILLTSLSWLLATSAFATVMSWLKRTRSRTRSGRA